MNPIRTIGRRGRAAAVAATRPGPPPAPPAEVIRFGPLSHTFNGVTGDMTGWQITLIAVGAALVGAVVGVLVDRARAARRHRPATAA